MPNDGVFQLKNPLAVKSIDGLLELIIDRVLIPLAIPIAIVIFIWVGFTYIKAQGKPEEITKAHKALLYTMIGLAIIFAAKGILLIIKGTIVEVSQQLN